MYFVNNLASKTGKFFLFCSFLHSSVQQMNFIIVSTFQSTLISIPNISNFRSNLQQTKLHKNIYWCKKIQKITLTAYLHQWTYHQSHFSTYDCYESFLPLTGLMSKESMLFKGITNWIGPLPIFYQKHITPQHITSSNTKVLWCHCAVNNSKDLSVT